MNIQLLKHCCTCGVIAYKVLKEFGYPEEFCRKGYFLGYVHDCMKPFEDKNFRNHMCLFEGLLDSEMEALVRSHEVLLESGEDYPTLKIALALADHTVNSKGEFVGFDGRLEDVANRYGRDSVEYSDSLQTITWLRARGYTEIEEKLLKSVEVIYDNAYEYLS